jgi:class 3 adenylate cyclase
VRTLHGQGYRFVAAVEVREHRPVDAGPPSLPRHPGADTPHQAATPFPALAPPRADLERPPVDGQDGEHKQLTVLCGALAEGPGLTARLGPEGLYRLLQAWLALVQEVVQHYGGTLLPSPGEGFVALFGAPVAQEDHARRAVVAACALQERCQTALPRHAPGDVRAVTVQLGLHSGLVVAGTLGMFPQQPYTAGGEATQVAWRLQQAAAPGTICLSAATYALVQEEIECASAGCLDVAGLPAAVPIYTVHGLRQRRAGVTGHGTRVISHFVGRAREMALLQASLAQVAQGQGQVLGLLGEPGLGKSRLLAEFRRRLVGQAVTSYAGQCLPYGQATPYLPLRDVVQQHCGLGATDQPEAVTAAVQRCVQAAGLRPEEDAAALLHLLERPVADAALTQRSPEERRARTFRVLHQLWQAVCQRQPLVLAVEDVHWIDATSEAWLATLVARLAGTPHGTGNRLPCPLAKRRVEVEGVDEHIGIQKDHGSRVSSRTFSHLIVGRRGALHMASIHALWLMRAVRSGFSSRMSRKRPSSCCWMSKTSSSRPPARQDNPLFGINSRYAHGGILPRRVSPVNGAYLACLLGQAWLTSCRWLGSHQGSVRPELATAR